MFVGHPHIGEMKASISAPERCRPDYEALIKRQQEQLSLYKKLLPALCLLHEEIGDQAPMTLSSFVGLLFLSIRRTEDCITRTIAEQERYDELASTASTK